jgi:hypothetical protein
MRTAAFDSAWATTRRPHARAGWPVWLAARARAWTLDRELAAGVPSWQSALHAARSRQLTADRSRRALARGLDALVERADWPSPRVTAAVPPCSEQVREARPLLFRAAARLRGAAPVDARGVAQLRLLLCDGTGPCFVNATPRALATAVAAALESTETSV